jgi:pimeloyl-ACP methyl ester carboxylesterase
MWGGEWAIEENEMRTRARKIPVVARILLILLAVLILAVGGLAVYQSAATASDRQKFPPPGQLVDVGGYRMHIYCIGEGSPTVILDALFPGTVSNWGWVQPAVAGATRVCAYDRAGLGWSDSGSEPRTAQQAARELHTLLTNAQIPGPYILVGHSLGGLSVQMYASMYPDQVAGMVLVEGTNPDSWVRRGQPEGVGADRNMLAMTPFLSRLGFFRLGLIRFFSSDPDLPERQREELQAFFDTAKFWDAVVAVDNSFSQSLEEVRQAGNLGNIPLAIVLGSKGDGSIPELQELFKQQAELSTNSLTRMVAGATHASLTNNKTHAAETSVAILLVVDAVRSGQPLAALK